MKRIEKVVTTYEECERCEGTGLEWEGKYSSDCSVCQGYGRNMVNKTIVEEIEDEHR